MSNYLEVDGEILNSRNDMVTKNYCIIPSLDEHRNEITHWTLLLNKVNAEHGNGNACYIDSFGLLPPEAISDQISNRYYVNTKKFQKYSSELCGIYCLYLIDMTKDVQRSHLVTILNLIISQLVNGTYSLKPMIEVNDDRIRIPIKNQYERKEEVKKLRLAKETFNDTNIDNSYRSIQKY